MAEQVAPTKSNLMKARASLSLSQSGYELLDKKRNVLIKEMLDMVDRAKSIQEEIYSVISEAYRALQTANITMGIKNLEDMAYGVSNDESFEVLLKSVMGVDIPVMKYRKREIVPSYGLINTNISLDTARQKFDEVRYRIYDLAEVENSIFKLAKEIEKTNKRTNALEHIQIPKYKEQVKYIQEVLEEKEREDFFRLKKVKKKIRRVE
jgi:V/A-type H+-transporting ATPase subunit D